MAIGTLRGLTERECDELMMTAYQRHEQTVNVGPDQTLIVWEFQQQGSRHWLGFDTGPAMGLMHSTEVTYL